MKIVASILRAAVVFSGQITATLLFSTLLIPILVVQWALQIRAFFQPTAREAFSHEFQATAPDMSSENERLQEVHSLWCAAVDQLTAQQPVSMPSENPILVDLLRRLSESPKTASYLKDSEFIQRIRQQRDINPPLPNMMLSWDAIPALGFGRRLPIRPFPSVIGPDDAQAVPSIMPSTSLTDEERLAALVAYTVIIRSCCRNVRPTENYEVPMFHPKQTETYCRGRFLGCGKNDPVYAVFNYPDRRVLAVKVRRTDGKWYVRKRVEQHLRNLNHPNVVRFIALYQQGTDFEFYTEYVPGGTIAGMVAALGPMPEEETRAVIKQVLAGLVYLHNMNFVHRGIKGANLLITMDGNIKISDVGMGKSRLPQNAQLFLATVPWISPEMLKEVPSGLKTDVWSVGCVILEMHLGRNPWTHMSVMDMAIQISEAKWPPIDRVLSRDLHATLEKVFVVEAERISSAEMQMEPWVKGEASH